MSLRAPKLSPEELIQKMKDKNIRCELKSEEEVTEYLKNHNNYFRTASYRKNYEKYLKGRNKGKYIDLDFFLPVRACNYRYASSFFGY